MCENCEKLQKQLEEKEVERDGYKDSFYRMVDRCKTAEALNEDLKNQVGEYCGTALDMAAQRDEWKDRAEKAEARLKRVIEIAENFYGYIDPCEADVVAVCACDDCIMIKELRAIKKCCEEGKP